MADQGNGDAHSNDDGTTDTVGLREDVESDLDDLTEKAAQEEAARMADRDKTGVDEPNESG